jgi:hypothetical protein
VGVLISFYRDAIEGRRVRVAAEPQKQKLVAKMPNAFDRCGQENCTDSLSKRAVEMCNLQTEFEQRAETNEAL